MPDPSTIVYNNLPLKNFAFGYMPFRRFFALILIVLLVTDPQTVFALTHFPYSTPSTTQKNLFQEQALAGAFISDLQPLLKKIPYVGRFLQDRPHPANPMPDFVPFLDQTDRFLREMHRLVQEMGDRYTRDYNARNDATQRVILLAVLGSSLWLDSLLFGASGFLVASVIGAPELKFQDYKSIQKILLKEPIHVFLENEATDLSEIGPWARRDMPLEEVLTRMALERPEHPLRQSYEHALILRTRTEAVRIAADGTRISGIPPLEASQLKETAHVYRRINPPDEYVSNIIFRKNKRASSFYMVRGTGDQKDMLLIKPEHLARRNIALGSSPLEKIKQDLKNLARKPAVKCLVILVAGASFVAWYGPAALWVSVPLVVAMVAQNMPPPPTMLPLENSGEWPTVVLARPLYSILSNHYLSSFVVIPPKENSDLETRGWAGIALPLLTLAIEKGLPGSRALQALLHKGNVLIFDASIANTAPGKDYLEEHSLFRRKLWEARLFLELERANRDPLSPLQGVLYAFQALRSPEMQRKLSFLNPTTLELITAHPLLWLVCTPSEYTKQILAVILGEVDDGLPPPLTGALLRLKHETEPQPEPLWEMRVLASKLPRTLEGSSNYYRDLIHELHQRRVLEIQSLVKHVLLGSELLPEDRVELEELLELSLVPGINATFDVWERIHELLLRHRTALGTAEKHQGAPTLTLSHMLRIPMLLFQLGGSLGGMMGIFHSPDVASASFMMAGLIGLPIPLSPALGMFQFLAGLGLWFAWPYLAAKAPKTPPPPTPKDLLRSLVADHIRRAKSIDADLRNPSARDPLQTLSSWAQDLTLALNTFQNSHRRFLFSKEVLVDLQSTSDYLDKRRALPNRQVQTVWLQGIQDRLEQLLFDLLYTQAIVDGSNAPYISQLGREDFLEAMALVLSRREQSSASRVALHQLTQIFLEQSKNANVPYLTYEEITQLMQRAPLDINMVLRTLAVNAIKPIFISRSNGKILAYKTAQPALLNRLQKKSRDSITLKPPTEMSRESKKELAKAGDFYEKGIARLNRRSIQAATPFFEQAVDLLLVVEKTGLATADRTRAGRLLGQIYFSLGQPERAFRIWRQTAEKVSRHQKLDADSIQERNQILDLLSRDAARIRPILNISLKRVQTLLKAHAKATSTPATNPVEDIHGLHDISQLLFNPQWALPIVMGFVGLWTSGVLIGMPVPGAIAGILAGTRLLFTRSPLRVTAASLLSAA